MPFVILPFAPLLAGRGEAEVIVSNLRTSQRPDASGLVDIRFDLAADDPRVTSTFVTISISPDGGQSWPIASPSAFFVGNVGAEVAIGPDRHIVWDAAADRPDVLWPNCRVRLRAGEYVIVLPGDIPLVLLPIPAGAFVMGSPMDERSRRPNEGPPTTVTLSRDFYVGKFEVTQAQWLAIMGAWPRTAPSTPLGLGSSYPAYNISWDDAQNFIANLNSYIAATGQGTPGMRLPTEAEWEYACRAGTRTRYSFGDSIIESDPLDLCSDDGVRSQYMWYCGNNAPYGQPGHGSKQVGEKLPNAWGLHDLHGNVHEWCQDVYSESLPGTEIVDPPGAMTGDANYRVIRGGAYGGNARGARSAYRSGKAKWDGDTGAGFRVFYVPGN